MAQQVDLLLHPRSSSANMNPSNRLSPYQKTIAFPSFIPFSKYRISPSLSLSGAHFDIRDVSHEDHHPLSERRMREALVCARFRLFRWGSSASSCELTQLGNISKDTIPHMQSFLPHTHTHGFQSLKGRMLREKRKRGKRILFA